MVKNTKRIRARGNEQRFTSGDMKEKTLDSDRFVTVFEQSGDTTSAYGPGYGPDDRDRAEGWSDFDLQNAAGNAVDGKYRWEIYGDSSKEDLIAVSSTFTAGDLRSSVAADRTNKRNMPAEQPLAGNDSYLVLAFKADPSNDGDSLSASNSAYDLGVAYSEYR